MESSAPVSQELRLALAMRGGVSLAVWIGGSCAEVDALCRSTCTGPDAGFYGRLARLAGFDRVTVDVLTGASAGGLNAALSAAAIAYGGDLDGLRDLWLTTADIDRLAHPAGNGAIDAPLRGDEYLLPQLRDALAHVASGAWQAPDALDVALAATLLTGDAVPAVQGDEVSFERRRGALFSFHAGPERWLNAFEHGDAGGRAVLDKLAVAGRATSSFPGAFEPAAVWAVRPSSFSAAGAGPTRAQADNRPISEPSLWGNFSHACAPDDMAPSAVIDGGVLDNIPIAQAIRAIGAARADAPTSRVLLFLHPSPSAEPSVDASGSASPTDGGSPPSVVDVAAAALDALTSQETILDDIAALRAFNDRVAAHTAARSALLATFCAADDATVVARVLDGAAAATASGAWHRWRAEHRGSRLTRMLDDPVAVIGRDLFPDPRMLHPLDLAVPPLPGDTRAIVASEIERATGGERGTGDPGATLGDDLARVQRLSAALRATIRDLEDHVPEAGDHAVLGRAKQTLYFVSLAADTVADTALLVWPALAVGRADALRVDPRGWVARTVEAHAALLSSHDPSRVAALGAALHAVREQSDDSGRVTDLVDQLRADLLHRLDGLVAGTAAHSPADDLAGTLAAVVERCAADIGTAAATVAPDACSHAPIAQLLRANSPQLAERLTALDVVLTPLTAWGPAHDRPITFRRISALNPTAVAPWFTRLTDGTDTIPLAGKLAGRHLDNFSGFLRAEYRANDWMWGRLDAAHTLIGVLTDAERLAARVRSTSPDEVIGQVRAAVLAPPGGRLDDLLDAATLAALWDAHEPAVRAEVTRLATGSAVAPRLVAVPTVLRERRHIELLAGELPTVDALRRGYEAPVTPTTLDDLRGMAAEHEIVPPEGIQLRPVDQIRPAADRWRSLAVRSLRRDHHRTLRAVLPWLDAAMRLRIRYDMRRLRATALGSAALLLAGAITALLPLPRIVPVVCWLVALVIPAAVVASARRPLGRAASLSDAFTHLPRPQAQPGRETETPTQPPG